MGNRPDAATAAAQKGILGQIGRNLTELARRGELRPLIGRQVELRRLQEVIARRDKNCPVLVGEPGVGKTAIVEGFAQRIVQASAAALFHSSEIIEVRSSDLLAGATHVGEFEQRMGELTKALQSNRDLILFIDEMHTLMASGTPGSKAVDMLKPYLGRGQMKLIGATTHDDFRQMQKDPAWERRMCPVLVKEMSELETLALLRAVSPDFAAHHGVAIQDDALAEAATLSARCLRDQYLPDKALELLDDAAACVRLDAAEEGQDVSRDDEATPVATVEAHDVRVALEKRLGRPIDFTTERLSKEDLDQLRAHLAEHIVGQDRAVDAVCDALKRSAAFGAAHRGPIASFLFVGPSGVGKTETARCLAQRVFSSDREAFIQIDCSQLDQDHTLSRLWGAPPGYVGHERGGSLTEKVRRHPNALVLLDEIEKMAPKAATDLLVQLLEEGSLTDMGSGRRIDFTQTIVVMTSNLGNDFVDSAASRVGFMDRQAPAGQGSGMEQRIEEAVRGFFPPEVLGRLGRIVPFERLSRGHVQTLLERELRQRMGQLSSVRTYTVADDVWELLLGHMEYEDYGAREVGRVLAQWVEPALADAQMDTHGVLKNVLLSVDDDGRLLFDFET